MAPRVITIVMDRARKDISIVENERACVRLNRDEALCMIASMILDAQLPPYRWMGSVEAQISALSAREE